MNCKAVILPLITMTLLSGVATSKSLYVSSSGTGDGLSQVSPMSMSSLVSALPSISGGDKILFKCGDTLRDSLNIKTMPDPSTPVTIGSYGVGNKPIITGAKRILNWTLYQNGIYKATMNEPVEHLICNGKMQTIARFPNTGYDSITASGGKASFTGFKLNQADASWNGATAHFRIQNDVIDRGVVGSISGGTATLSVQPDYNIPAKNGYYLDNKLAFLDAENEWVQDGNTIYCKPSAGVNINSAVIEGMVLKCAIRGEYKNNMIVRDLSIQAFSTVGIIFNPGANYKVINCEFLNMGRDGINIWGQGGSAINVVVDSCIFKDVLNNAIKGDNSSNYVTITNNTLKRIGLIPGYEVPVMVAGQAMSINCSNSLFEGNIIDSVGYGGINAIGINNTVIHNVIGNTGMSKNDCGPFQTWGGTSSNWLIKENICYNSWGNQDGLGFKYSFLPKGSPSMSEGIYFDSFTHDCKVVGNTVFNTQSGIFIQASQNFEVRDNTVYNNAWNQIFINELPTELDGRHDASWLATCTGIVLKNNVMYSVRAFQTGLRVSSDRVDSPLNFGVYDSNYYFNPYRSLVVTRSIQPSNANRVDSALTLVQWKQRTGQDVHSTTNSFQWSEQQAVTTGGNKVTNGTFATALTGWGTYQSGVTSVYETNAKLDGGCLKLTNVNEVEADLSSGAFTFDSAKSYLVKFSCIASKTVNADVMFWKVPESGGWGSNRSTFVVDTFRSDMEVVIEPTSSAAQAKLSFRTPKGSTIWFDNISVEEVVSVGADNYLERSKLFVNDTRQSKTFNLGTTAYTDLDGNIVTGSITIAPYRSKILIIAGGVTSTPDHIVFATTYKNPMISYSVNRNSILVKTDKPLQNGSVLITDLVGHTIFQKQFGTVAGYIVNKQLPKGTFIVRIKSGSIQEHKKVIVN